MAQPCENCECDISGDVFVLTRGDEMQIWCSDCWDDLRSEMYEEGWDCEDDDTHSWEEEQIRGHVCADCGAGLDPATVIFGCGRNRAYGCDTRHCAQCGNRPGEWKCWVCCVEVIADDTSDCGAPDSDFVQH